MKGLIVYATSYGTTKQYAEWIAEEVGVETRSYKEVKDSDLQGADFLIIGSMVLAHRLFLTKWLTTKEALLQGKTLFIYSVSGAKPGDKELEDIFDTLPELLLKGAKTYRFGGKMRFQELSGFHKLLMRIGTLIEKDPETKAEMKKDMKIAKDNINRAYIDTLVQDFKAYRGSRG